jgi:tRNA threonylcarbamoyladenosine biosynthesis protein TsaB
LKILALDTSTEYCSAALLIDGETDVRDTHAGQTHSQWLLRMIDELLRSRSLRLRDLDGIAYGEGPGSFTGLRIACGVVQGLAFGADLPVVGIGTLRAMAEGSASDRVLACIDARMNEIYHAAYEKRAGHWYAVHEPSVCAPAAAPLVSGEGWHGCGSAFIAHGEKLKTRYAGSLAAVEPHRYPHAREIARLSLPQFEAKAGVPSDRAVPVYIRDKVALRIDERARP